MCMFLTILQGVRVAHSPVEGMVCIKGSIRGFNPIVEISEIWKNRMASGMARDWILEANLEKLEKCPPPITPV